MQDLLTIIERYYPKRKDYTFEKYETNRSLPELVELCRRGLQAHPDWDKEFLTLKQTLPHLVLNDYTVLITEPSFFFHAALPGQRDILYSVSISVMAPCYVINRQSVGRDVAFEEAVHRLVQREFPGYAEMTEEEGNRLVPSVMVPAHQWFIDEGKSPSVGDCIFGIRAMTKEND